MPRYIFVVTDVTSWGCIGCGHSRMAHIWKQNCRMSDKKCLATTRMLVLQRGSALLLTRAWAGDSEPDVSRVSHILGKGGGRCHSC